jgi:hypothetical protein
MSENYYYDPHSRTQEPYKYVNTIGKYKGVENRNKIINIQEELKNEIFKQDTGSTGGGTTSKVKGYKGESTLIDNESQQTQASSQAIVSGSIPRPLNEGISDTYIYFDSDFKNSASDMTNGRLSFSIVELNQSRPIDNIVEMQIGEFFIPDIATGASFPDYFFYRRVNILIEEMQTQAIRSATAKRAHFEMNVESSGIANLLKPSSNDGKFIFQRPFRDIDFVTFKFTAPIAPISFQPDLITFTSVPGSSPARITTNVPHELTVASSVSIFVHEFVSNVANVDIVINSKKGHLVTVIDANTLEFPAVGVVGFDFTGVGAITATVTIGFRRIAFVVRFRSIEDIRTNRIVHV